MRLELSCPDRIRHPRSESDPEVDHRRIACDATPRGCIDAKTGDDQDKDSGATSDMLTGPWPRKEKAKPTTGSSPRDRARANHLATGEVWTKRVSVVITKVYRSQTAVRLPNVPG
jgi:hypothetical protein